MRVWRISKGLYAGRWNPAGIRMVYTSTSLALAAIELFVHLDPSEAPDDLISISAILPTSEVSFEVIDPKNLPADWRAMEHPGLRELGAEWVRSRRSCALRVPSIAVEGEWNVLLNPAHAEFAKITLLKPKPFHFDERMFKVK
jgi:RES domain-containing protein